MKETKDHYPPGTKKTSRHFPNFSSCPRALDTHMYKEKVEEHRTTHAHIRCRMRAKRKKTEESTQEIARSSESFFLMRLTCRATGMGVGRVCEGREEEVVSRERERQRSVLTFPKRRRGYDTVESRRDFLLFFCFSIFWGAGCDERDREMGGSGELNGANDRGD